DERVQATAQMTEDVLSKLVEQDEGVLPGLRTWQGTATRPFAHRVANLQSWFDSAGKTLQSASRNTLSRELYKAAARAKDVISVWADLLTDRRLLGEGFARLAPGEFTTGELDRAHAWCVKHVTRAISD